MAAIQTEYAAFMERVRALAQAAIDEANASFQATRHGVTVHLDALVALFQARFYAGAPAAAASGGAPPSLGDGGGRPARTPAPAAAAPGGGPMPGALAANADVLAAHLAGPPGGGGLPLTRLSREQMAALAAHAAAAIGAPPGNGGTPPPSPPGPAKTATVRAGGEERTVVIDADHAALLDAAAAAPARPRRVGGAGGGPPSPRSPRAEQGSPFAAVPLPASPRPPSAAGLSVSAVARESSLREWAAPEAGGPARVAGRGRGVALCLQASRGREQ